MDRIRIRIRSAPLAVSYTHLDVYKRQAEPYSAEKQVITESEDIADLYSLFSGLEVSDKIGRAHV